MRIQHNIMAMNSYRNFTNNTKSVAKNLEKLSSGYRINGAGDDAAGLAVSEKMRAQITGLKTAQKNAKDGISLVKTAEGALTEVHSMLNRMVDLAGQSANGTYDDPVDRKNLQKEVDALKSEIDRIADSTNFNGIKLLDGKLGTGTTGVKAAATIGTTGITNQLAGASAGLSFDVSGMESGKKIKFVLGAAAGGDSIAFTNGDAVVTIAGDASRTFTQQDMDALIKNSTLPDSAKGLNIKMNKDVVVGIAAAISTDITAPATIAQATKATSAIVNTTNVQGQATNFQVTSNTAGADTRDLVIGTGSVGASVNGANGNVTLNLDATKEYSASQINQMLADAGANMSVSFDGTITSASTGIAATHTLGAGKAGAGLASGGGLTLQIGDTSDSFNKMTVKVGDMHSASLGISSVDISTQDGASSAMEAIKSAINSVSGTRGDLGALQNRLDHTINNLSVMHENIQDAEATIRDTDVADEMMAYTKNNILVQSAQAMLAQANQVPQGVLQLLG